MELVFEAVIDNIEEGAIKGQLIAEASYKGGSVRFDMLRDLINANVGDSIKIVISDSMPGNLEEYMFCGRGYKIPSTGDKTIFSVWGIIFRFDGELGLEEGREYILCIKK